MDEKHMTATDLSLRGGSPIWDLSDVAEFSVLLPGSQASAIEEIARMHGVTVGQMIRLLVRSYLNLSGSKQTAGTGSHQL